MIPGCTHAVDLALDDKTIDLNQASDVYVTLKQGGTLITLTGAALDVNWVESTGQTDTIYFKDNNSWVAATKVYKKVNGAWVQQSDLSNVFDPNTNYLHG